MQLPPWFEWVPDLLSQEKRAFREKGVPVRIDQKALKAGVVKFAGRVPVDGKSVLLEIHYPDGFPHVPPQVYAPELTLSRHQNPYLKNLCVWPTGTQPWDAHTRGADLIAAAVRLIGASLQGAAEVEAIEERAPDIKGAFYNYTAQSSLLIPEEALEVPQGTWGRIELLGPSQSAPHRALLKRAVDFSRTGWDATAPPNLKAVFKGGDEVVGLWVKINEYPPFSPRETFVDEFFEWFWSLPAAKNVRTLQRGATLGWYSQTVEVVGVCYPEEFDYQDYTRSNWLVVLRFTDANSQRHVIFRPQAVPTSRAYFQRIPRLASLKDKAAAIIGLGALGSQVAVELAKAGLGRQYLVDGDILEPANLVRHVCSLSEVGLTKAEAVASRIQRMAPSCEVIAVPMHFGALRVEAPKQARDTSLEVLEYIGHSDLIVDAAADDALSYLTNKVGARLEIPQVYVRATNGGWGGEILRVIPHETSCFECFMRENEINAPIRPQEDPHFVTALGCADRTFTGSGFDIASVSLLGVRMAVQTLLRGEEIHYPDADYDYLSWMNTSHDGAGHPKVIDTKKIARSAQCRICSGEEL